MSIPIPIARLRTSSSRPGQIASVSSLRLAVNSTSQPSGSLARELDALVRVGFVEVVLDLRGVEFMDVAGLRLVLGQARREGVILELIDGPPAVARVFDLAQVRGELALLSRHEIARRGY